MTCAHAFAFSAAALPARRPKTVHIRGSELPIIRLRPCVPPAISPQAKSPFERRLGVGVDHEAAVLVVEDRVGEDRLRERVDPGAAVAPQHVRQRDLGVVLRDPRGVEVDGGAAVLGLDALALLDLVEDRLADLVARAERVGELLAVGVQEHGAVGARRLGDRVALHRLGPGAAVRVVLELVEVARLGAEVERDPRHLAGRVRVVRRELAALLGDAEAAAARREDDGRRVELVLAAGRAPAVLARLERGERAVREERAADASKASRSAFVIAWPVRSPTWSRRFAVAPPQRARR